MDLQVDAMHQKALLPTPSKIPLLMNPPYNISFQNPLTDDYAL